MRLKLPLAQVHNAVRVFDWPKLNDPVLRKPMDIMHQCSLKFPFMRFILICMSTLLILQ